VKIISKHLYINRGRYVPWSVCHGEPRHGHAAKPRPTAALRAPGLPRATQRRPRPCEPRGKATSCHGKAAYNLVIINCDHYIYHILFSPKAGHRAVQPNTIASGLIKLACVNRLKPRKNVAETRVPSALCFGPFTNDLHCQWPG